MYYRISVKNWTFVMLSVGYSIFKRYRGIDELFQGVWALIFQGVLVSFSDFPRGFLKVSRGFFLRKLSSIVVFPGFPAPFSQNFTFQRGLPLNFQGVICYSKFPRGVSEKVHQYPCIIFFGIAHFTTLPTSPKVGRTCRALKLHFLTLESRAC